METGEKYIPHVADAIREIMGLKEEQKKEMEVKLAEILEQSRGELEEIGIDNPDYDPELAKIGREEEEEEPVEEEVEVLHRGAKGKKAAEGDDDDDDSDDDTDEEERQTRLE